MHHYHVRSACRSTSPNSMENYLVTAIEQLWNARIWQRGQVNVFCPFDCVSISLHAALELNQTKPNQNKTSNHSLIRAALKSTDRQQSRAHRMRSSLLYRILHRMEFDAAIIDLCENNNSNLWWWLVAESLSFSLSVCIPFRQLNAISWNNRIFGFSSQMSKYNLNRRKNTFLPI